MSKPQLIVIGAGGHAQACIDVIEQENKYEIAGLVGVSSELNTQFLGYSIIATDNDLQELAKEYRFAFIAIGQIKSPVNRIRLYQKLFELGFQFPQIISPTATVSQYATIGDGSIIMNGVIINAGAKVGINCIINTKAVLEHNVTVNDNCHISTGAMLNGDVTVDSGSFIGSGCIIKEGITIGSNCLVGMGLSVRHNQADNSRFLGKTNYAGK